MASIAEIRRLYPDQTSNKSDAEIIRDISGGAGLDTTYVAGRLGFDINDPGFVTGVKQGLGGFAGGIGRLVDDATGGNKGAISRYAEDVQFRNPSSAASESWEGFKESPWQGVKEFAGSAVGSTAPSLIPFAGQAGKGASLVGRGLAVGRTLGAQTALAATPIYGSIRQEQDQEGISDIPRAALASLGAGVVESKLGIQGALARNAAARPVAKEVAEFGATPWRTAGKSWARQGLEEGGEEILQQPMQQWAAHQDVTSEKSLRDTGWSGFGGVIGGLALGPLAAGSRGLRHAQIKRDISTDLLNIDQPFAQQQNLGEYEREFMNKRGEDGGAFYDNFMRQQFEARNQRVEDGMLQQRFDANEQRNLEIQRLADQERIAARAPSNNREVYPNQFGTDQALENLIERRAFGLGNEQEQQDFWSGVPDPTLAPGKFNKKGQYAGQDSPYQQFWNHVAPVTEANADLYGATPDMFGGDPSFGIEGQYSEVNPQAPQQVNKRQGTLNFEAGAPQQTLYSSNLAGVIHNQLPITDNLRPKENRKARQKPLNKQAQDFEAKVQSAIDAGQIDGNHQIVRDWVASDKKVSTAKAFTDALADITAGANVTVPTAEASLKAKAAVKETKPVHFDNRPDFTDWALGHLGVPAGVAEAYKRVHNIGEFHGDEVVSHDMVAPLFPVQTSGRGKGKTPSHATVTKVLNSIHAKVAELEKVHLSEAAMETEVEQLTPGEVISEEDAATGLKSKAEDQTEPVALDDALDQTNEGDINANVAAGVSKNAAAQWEAHRQRNQSDIKFAQLPRELQEAWSDILSSSGEAHRKQQNASGTGADEITPAAYINNKFKDILAGIKAADDLLVTPKAEDSKERTVKPLAEKDTAGEDAAKVAAGVEAILAGDNSSAAAIIQILGGKNGQLTMQWLHAHTGMPAAINKPVAAVEYFVNQAATNRANALAEAEQYSDVWGEGFDKLSEDSKVKFCIAAQGLGDLIYTPSILRQIKGDISGNTENEQVHKGANESTGGTEGSSAEAQRSSDGGVGPSGANQSRTPEVKVRKTRRVAQREVALSQSEAPAHGGSKADTIAGKLQKLFFSPAKFNSLVTVVQSTDDLTGQAKQDMSQASGNVQGFVGTDGRVYLIADNIPQGKELAVFLHEVGVHLGMEKLVGKANMERLTSQIEKWAAEDNHSLEHQLAKAAVARAAKSSSENKHEEVLAYFVELAVNSGINPAAVNKMKDGQLKNWFRTLWAAAKVALRKLGLGRFDQLTSQNLVDLAFGAAKMEMTGTWHGTAAEFRNFDHKYMNTGEGAQAFGWGTYLAQRVGIAKGYWSADVKRKKNGGSDYEQVFVDGKAPAQVFGFNNDAFFFEGGELQPNASPSELKKALLDNVDRQIKQTEWMLRSENIRAPIDEADKLFMDEYDAKRREELSDLKVARTQIVQAHSDRFGLPPKNSTEGALMRVDTAVHDDEFLDWDKPLSEQSDVVKAAIKDDPKLAEAMGVATRINNSGGEGLYNALSKNIGYELGTKTPSARDKAASEHLDSLGIKGIRFLDHASRNGNWAMVNYTDAQLQDMLDKGIRESAHGAIRAELERRRNQTRNLVIFNDKNIQRVTSQIGASRNKVKFSQVSEAVERIGGQSGSMMWTNASGLVAKAMRSMMSLHDLVAEYGNVLQSAPKWYKSILATQATRNKLEADAESIAERASKLKADRQEALNQFVAKSTLEQKWGYDAEFEKTDGTKRVVKADPEMAKEFAKLRPEERAIAEDMFAHGEKMKVTKFRILKELGLSGVFNQTGSLDGPYAPLKRFGDHVGVLKSAELVAAEAAEDEKRVEELKADPKHYRVSYFDTSGLAKRFADENKADWALAQHFPKALHIKEHTETNLGTLQKVMAAMKVEGKLPPEAYKQVQDMLSDMHMSQFDEHNARMSGLKRKNRAGYDVDMVRSFLAHSKAEAGFLANMKHGGETNEAFYEMQRQAAKAPDRKQGLEVLNAISSHYADQLDFKNTPIQDRLMALTSIMQLATNPAYHIQNLLQPMMVSIPRLAADFGDYVGAWRHLQNGYRVVGKTGAGADMDLTKAGSKELQDALQAAADAQLLEVGMAEDLTQFEATRTGFETVDMASSYARKVVHGLRKISRRVEATNRISAGVAAFNMSMERENNPAKATEYMLSVLRDTQGDFSRTDAPLLLKKLPKIVGQYRKFQLMMMAHYAKAFRDAFISEDPKVREVGRRALAYSLGHAFMGAGALGMPLANLVGIMFKAMGGDDEPKDLERWMRENLGDSMFADMLTHGPAMYMGLDAKLSQDKVFSILPYADWGLTSKEGVKNLVWGLAGPSGSNIQKMADGLDSMKSGDYYDGLEKLLPNGFTNALKAFRIANEGYTLNNGDIMVKPEDITGFQLAMDAVGVKSPEMRKMDWFKNQQYEIKRFYIDRTKEVQQDYAEAVKSGDTDTIGEARDNWLDLQAGKDNLRMYFNDSSDELKKQPLSTLLKYPQTQAKREAKLQKSVPQ
jgi:hypothetical protein